MVACVAGLVGGLTKNVAAGIAIGGLVGAVAGAIGSAVVCYNTFDATYPFLKYSLSLTISCIVAGAVTGRLAAFAAKSKATEKNNPVIEKKENPGQIDIEEDLNSNGNNNPNPIEKEIINKDPIREHIDNLRNNEYNHRYVIADKNSELNLKELFKENHGEKTRTEHLTINGHEIEIEMSKNLDVDIDDLNGLINTLEDIERNDLKIKIESVEIKGKQSLSEKGIGYNEIRDYYGITINTVIETVECDYLISPDFFKTKCVDPLNTGEICLENTKIIYSSKIKISPNEMTEYGFKEMKRGYSRTVVNVENYGDVLLEYPSEMKDIPLKEVTNRISNIGGNTGPMTRDGINYGSIRCIKIVNQGTKGLGIIVKCGDMHTCIDKFISIPLGQSKFYMYKSIRFKEYYCPIH